MWDVRARFASKARDRRPGHGTSLPRDRRSDVPADRADRPQRFRPALAAIPGDHERPEPRFRPGDAVRAGHQRLRGLRPGTGALLAILQPGRRPGPGGDLVTGVWETVTYDTVPVGEVAVRRGERARATDGGTGQVERPVIDPRNHHVTRVLPREGHLWGRNEAAVPISAVTGVEQHHVQDFAACGHRSPERVDLPAAGEEQRKRPDQPGRKAQRHALWQALRPLAEQYPPD